MKLIIILIQTILCKTFIRKKIKKMLNNLTKKINKIKCLNIWTKIKKVYMIKHKENKEIKLKLHISKTNSKFNCIKRRWKWIYTINKDQDLNSIDLSKVLAHFFLYFIKKENIEDRLEKVLCKIKLQN